MSIDVIVAPRLEAGAATRPRSFPFLLLPSFWASRNRARRGDRGDVLRALVFGGIGLGVMSSLAAGAFWVTVQAAEYAELGDYLIRIGLSWLFLTFLSFLAFSGVVSTLATFFLSDDLRLVLAAPVAARRVFLARFARTVAQSGWMVVVFLVPVLL
jgi:ABC-2 type transport system permease protein